jgi:mRNA-degrading endonuclease toxin of MazEF toxin-antitoxin module
MVFQVTVLWLLEDTAAVNVSQMATLDKSALLERVGVLPQDKLAQIDAGVRLVLGI